MAINRVEVKFTYRISAAPLITKKEPKTHYICYNIFTTRASKNEDNQALSHNKAVFSQRLELLPRHEFGGL
jgi:hypothetical protein